MPATASPGHPAYDFVRSEAFRGFTLTFRVLRKTLAETVLNAAGER